jgi:hypothetical protein
MPHDIFKHIMMCNTIKTVFSYFINNMMLLRKAISVLYALIIAVLAVATFVERNAGTRTRTQRYNHT